MNTNLSPEQIEVFAQRAQDYFRRGFNCSQSVVAACAPLFGVDEELALRLSASFGGGIGRMRSVCGAASGMFILEGLASGSAVEGDTQAKMTNYARVRNLAASFQQQHGSLICAELLGLTPPPSASPSASTSPNSKKLPCVQMVANAVRIFLSSQENN